jgi:hypothetical protein
VNCDAFSSDLQQILREKTNHWRLSGQRGWGTGVGPDFCFIGSMLCQRLLYATLFLPALTGCGARAHIEARNSALSLAPTCANAVPVYASSADIPYDYYEVALITGEGNSVYTGNGDVLKAVRSQAASVGANGVVVDSLRATHVTVKILGAAVGGSDAERKARAIAIWMPSDTARVREACSGR